MRLIDADALKEKKVYSVERHENVVSVAEIDWMPTVDAVPVRRGRWKAVKAEVENYAFWNCQCSACKWTTSILGAGTFNFCSRCGADMREDKDNAAN